MRAVENLKKWLIAFDQPKEYVVLAIRVWGLPEVPWSQNEWGGYDPAVSFKITEGKGRADPIVAVDENREGDFRLTKFKTNTRFRWCKDYPIALGIWDDKTDLAGRCMGQITLDEPYSLLYLALSNSKLGVNAQDHDYKGTPGMNQLRLGLEIQGLQPPPQLPK